VFSKLEKHGCFIFIRMRNHNVLPYTAEARDLSKRLRANMTKTERLFWDQVKASQLSVVVRRQMPILDYVVDFYIKSIGLAIELDGSSHHNNVLEDGKRQSRIEELGVTFIRFSNHEVQNNMESVLKKLIEVIRERS
jgi:very-short-patch-repair endonuclease